MLEGTSPYTVAVHATNATRTAVLDGLAEARTVAEAALRETADAELAVIRDRRGVAVARWERGEGWVVPPAEDPDPLAGETGGVA